MSDTPSTFKVRAGSGGEVMVIGPNGNVEFMSLWSYIKFVWTAIRMGHRVEYDDE